MKLRVLLLADILVTLVILGAEFLPGVSMSLGHVDTSTPMVVSSDNEIGLICLILPLPFCLINVLMKIIGLINNRWRTKWASCLLIASSLIAVSSAYMTIQNFHAQMNKEVQTRMDMMRSLGVEPAVSTAEDAVGQGIKDAELFGTKLPSPGIGFYSMLLSAIALGLLQFVKRSDNPNLSKEKAVLDDSVTPISSKDTSASSDIEETKDTSVHKNDVTSSRKLLYILGCVLFIALLAGGVYLLWNNKTESGVFAGKPISELFPQVEKASDSGMIPDSPTIYEWDVSQGEECGGDVTVVRKADENHLVIMYETNSCDANILRLGVYQSGQYVFYYELPVGNLDYDETKNGISLHADLPKSTIYYGYYGKDMAKSIEQEWGTEHSLDWNKVSESQLADLFKNALNDGPKGSPFILTYNEIKANMGGAAISENMEEKELSGFSYLVGNAEFGLDLYVDVDGEKFPTGISGTAETLDIFHQYDFDGDGEKEALVYEWGGGNAAYPPYIVYYDKESKAFKKAEGFETIFGENDVDLEPWKGKQSIVVKAGLETSRYIYENYQLKKVESKTVDMGPELMTYTCKQLFGNNSEGEKSVNLDLNDDGIDEKLVFTNNDSHAFDDGNAMMLEKIIWGDGTETFGCHQVASSFTFLMSLTAGVHDMITNGRQLQKWTGEEYKE